MDNLSQKEIDILRFIRTQRHKTTVEEIARGLGLGSSEVDVLVQGLLHRDLIKVVSGATRPEDGYYTNPEHRERIFEILD